MKEIKIKPNTSIEDIPEDWGKGLDGELIFEISGSSSFQIFAEGVWLGFLRDCEKAKKTITIRFHKQTKIHLNDLLESPLGDIRGFLNLGVPKILCGIFGLQLLYQSRGVRGSFVEEVDEEIARSYIGTKIWKYVLGNNGLIDGENYKYIISRHDYRVPKVIVGNVRNIDFPLPKVFREKVSRLLPYLGSTKKTVDEVGVLVGSWVYHLAENAFEHGSVDFETNDKLLLGFSGILIQKVMAPNDQHIKAKKNLNQNFKNYLSALKAEGDFTPRDGLTVVSVMDGGFGIQNTLPEKYTTIDEVDRLNMAFSRGVTRRSIGENRAGYGLFDSIRAARKLKSYVFVCSGSICLGQSYEDLKGDTVNFSGGGKKVNKKFGTSHTLVWRTGVQKYKDKLGE